MSAATARRPSPPSINPRPRRQRGAYITNLRPSVIYPHPPITALAAASRLLPASWAHTPYPRFGAASHFGLAPHFAAASRLLSNPAATYSHSPAAPRRPRTACRSPPGRLFDDSAYICRRGVPCFTQTGRAPVPLHAANACPHVALSSEEISYSPRSRGDCLANLTTICAAAGQLPGLEAADPICPGIFAPALGYCNPMISPHHFASLRLPQQWGTSRRRAGPGRATPPACRVHSPWLACRARTRACTRPSPPWPPASPLIITACSPGPQRPLVGAWQRHRRPAPVVGARQPSRVRAPAQLAASGRCAWEACVQTPLLAHLSVAPRPKAQPHVHSIVPPLATCHRSPPKQAVRVCARPPPSSALGCPQPHFAARLVKRPAARC